MGSLVRFGQRGAQLYIPFIPPYRIFVSYVENRWVSRIGWHRYDNKISHVYVTLLEIIGYVYLHNSLLPVIFFFFLSDTRISRFTYYWDYISNTSRILENEMKYSDIIFATLCTANNTILMTCGCDITCCVTILSLSYTSYNDSFRIPYHRCNGS